ncbi:trypsin-like serine peptidase [Sulfurovum lithotrophicum]|uniref:trypsin-like serine peptidase n=1 Tax=Sulfurovum lithotrophicum TaxID=206403 RepID=UPI0006962A67|nr:trypsin-like serine protease [Sulfurovum lithotrophicum]
MNRYIQGLIAGGICTAIAITSAGAENGVVVHRIQNKTAINLDYAHAIAMPLPLVSGDESTIEFEIASTLSEGEPGVSKGSAGPVENIRAFISKVPESETEESDRDVTPMEFGTTSHPFSTTRVDVYGNKISYRYPYRAAGKLFFKIGSSTYVCSASLIKPGLVVTAAHCVSEFGQNEIFSDFEFIPAYYKGIAPYGKWKASHVTVKESYLDGTDHCAVTGPGVVCENDVAIITLKPVLYQGEATYAGDLTGWLSYGWDGWGYTTFNKFGDNSVVQLTQLGYPVSHDSGRMMQRTDSTGYVSGINASNTIIGSRQTGGSSGGPWIANLGEIATLSGTFVGSDSTSNTVLGVTSWGYTTNGPKEMGASPFTSTNIVELVDGACADTPSACSE